MSDPGLEVRSGHEVRPRARQRRAFAVGMAISFAAHALGIALYSLAWAPLEGRLPAGDPSGQPLERLGTRILEIRETSEELDSEGPERPPPPVVAQTTPPPEPVTELEAVDETVVEADPEETAFVPTGEERDGSPDLTLAQRLQPQPGDPRIWNPFPAELVEPTENEHLQLMVDALLVSWNDSVAVAEAVANRARDWTYTDDNGLRWGLASGRLYLGDYSIPLPVLNIAPNRLEDARRQWQLDDLARSAASAEMRLIQADRARAIRERYEAERARAAVEAVPEVEPTPP